MARILRNVGEYVSGKVGNVVFVRMKNKSYVRKAPDCSKVVWSDQQINYRNRTSSVGALYRSLRFEMIIDIWHKSDPDMPVFAQFMKKNINALTISGQLIDPLLLKISDGPLVCAQNFEISLMDTSEKTLFVTWENDPNLKPSRLADFLYCVFYDAETKKFTEPFDSFMERELEVGSILFPPAEIMANPSHVFLFWRSEDPVCYSNSSSFIIPEI